MNFPRPYTPIYTPVLVIPSDPGIPVENDHTMKQKVYKANAKTETVDLYSIETAAEDGGHRTR